MGQGTLGGRGDVRSSLSLVLRQGREALGTPPCLLQSSKATSGAARIDNHLPDSSKGPPLLGAGAGLGYRGLWQAGYGPHQREQRGSTGQYPHAPHQVGKTRCGQDWSCQTLMGAQRVHHVGPTLPPHTAAPTSSIARLCGVTCR